MYVKIQQQKFDGFSIICLTTVEMISDTFRRLSCKPRRKLGDVIALFFILQRGFSTFVEWLNTANLHQILLEFNMWA